MARKLLHIKWNPIKDHPGYEISTYGQVRHIETQITVRSYGTRIRIDNVYMSLAPLMYKTFIDPGNTHRLYLIDKNKTNFRIDNIELIKDKNLNKPAPGLRSRTKFTYEPVSDEYGNWRLAKRYPTLEVSDQGYIRKIVGKNLLGRYIDNSGMYFLFLKKRVLVANVVANSFCLQRASHKPYLRHIDYDTSNNCASNLVWLSRPELVKYHSNNPRFKRK